MIFQHTHQRVMAGHKTQTRRLVKPGDEALMWDGAVVGVVGKGGRMRWALDGVYAVQPGRGKKAVGHIKVKAIWRENVRDITAESAVDELGWGEPCLDCDALIFHHQENRAPHWWFMTGDVKDCYDALMDFADLWDRIHTSPGARWSDNPEVWAIEFELTTKENGNDA